MHCVLHQGNCGHLRQVRTASQDLVMSNQKGSMIKELRCHRQSAQLLMIKQSLTALETVFLSNEDM